LRIGWRRGNLSRKKQNPKKKAGSGHGRAKGKKLALKKSAGREKKDRTTEKTSTKGTRARGKKTPTGKVGGTRKNRNVGNYPCARVRTTGKLGRQEVRGGGQGGGGCIL